MTSLAYAALCLFVFAVPWERIFALPGLSITTRIAGGSALLVAMLAIVVSGRVRRWHGFHVAAFLFVIWVGFALFLIQVHQLPQKFWTYVQLFAVLWMIWELASSRQRVLGLMLAFVCGAYVSALGTILVFLRAGGSMKRYTAGGDANDLAMTLAVALPMAWYLGMTHRRRLVQWICRAYLPISLVAVGLTGSRGGLLATFMALLIVPLTMTNLSPAKLATAISLLGLGGVLAAAYVPDTLVERFASTTTEVEDLRFGGRFKLWVAGFHAFVSKPVIGYGAGEFKDAITPELGSAAQVAHNSFISVLVEEGLVGLIIYVLMLLAVYSAILGLPPPERRFALVVMATLMVAMSPLTWEDHKVVWFTLAALLGFARAPGWPLARVVGRPLARRAAGMRPVAVGRRGVTRGGRDTGLDAIA
jgi:O-antigen ligase